MTDQRLYSVVFAGELLDGGDPEQVRTELARRFRLDSEQVARLFSGRAVTIRRDLSLRQAHALRQAFRAAGANCEVRPQPAAAQLREPQATSSRRLGAEALEQAFACTLTPESDSRGLRVKRALASAVALLVPALYPATLLLLALFALVRIARPVFDPDRGLAAALLLDALPAALALLVLVWLLRPQLWRQQHDAVVVEDGQAPLLRALVARVATQVGAPAPLILLDAEPRLCARWRLRQRRLELRLFIGLPLLAALDTRQLAGLLARELTAAAPAHAPLPRQWLRDGLARLRQSVRREDALDRALARWAADHDGYVGLAATRLLAFLRLPHRLLQRLSDVSARLAWPLLRAGESTVVQRQLQLAGSEAAEETARCCLALTQAWRELAEDLIAVDGAELLSEDLAGLIAWYAREREISPQDANTGPDWLDWLGRSVPPPGAVVEPGFALRAPAKLLLDDYAALAQRLGLASYHRLGLAVGADALVAPTVAEAALAQRRRSAAAFLDYFRGYLPPGHVVVPAGIEQARVMKPEERVAELENAVAEVRRAVPDMTKLRQQYAVAAEALHKAEVALALVPYRPSPQIEITYRECRADMLKLEAERNRLDALVAHRLGLGLAEALAQTDEPRAMAAEIAEAGAALVGLAALEPELAVCRRELARVRTLMAAKGPNGRLPEYAFMTHMSESWHRLERIAARLNDIRLGGASLAERIQAKLPPPAANAGAAALGRYLDRLDTHLERYRQRLLGRLAALAGAAEEARDIRIKLL